MISLIPAPSPQNPHIQVRSKKSVIMLRYDRPDLSQPFPNKGGLSVQYKSLSYSLAVLPSILIFAACSQSDAPQRSGERAARAVAVIAAPIVFENDIERIEAVGTARAKQSATVFPESAGEVTRIGFDAGDFVQAGAVLAQLDRQAEELAVARARVAVRDAEQLLSRYQRIDVPGAISDSQIDAARTSLDAAQIELELAELALSERSVRAPFAGHVGLSDIDRGARITTNTEITRLDDRTKLYVDFSAPEEVFGGVNVGDELPLQPFAGQSDLVTGSITAIDSRIDDTRRSFTIRAEIDNEGDALRPGMSFRVAFEMPGNAYPSIPEEAISWGGDGAYIWLVRDETAARTPISLISRREGSVLAEADVVEGDLIVVEGVQKVREGTKVRTSLSAGDDSDMPPRARARPTNYSGAQ